MDSEVIWFLIIDDDQEDRDAIANLIDAESAWRFTAHESYKKWMEKASQDPDLTQKISVAIIDWKLLDGEQGDLVAERLRKDHPSIATFALTREGTDAVVKSIESRLFDTWLEKDFGRQAWRAIFVRTCTVLTSLARERRARRASENRTLPRSSEVDASVSRLVPQLSATARSLMPVLILGESGTGKESVARAIHDASCIGGDCYPVNCASFEGNMALSALFGHRRGAFSGAETHQTGAILAAAGVRPTGDGQTLDFDSWLRTSPVAPRYPSSQGSAPSLVRFGRGMTGTLFLDEVADLPAYAQALLLRFLDGNGFHPVGYAGSPLAPSVRIIAATSQRDKMIGKGVNPVRRDLYFRLAGWVVQLPPLHERPDDGVAVAESVLERELNKTLSADGRSRLRESLSRRDGPFRTGNLRSLIWCVKRAAWLSGDMPEISQEGINDAMQEKYAGPIFDTPKQIESGPRADLTQLVRRLATGSDVDPKEIVSAVKQRLAIPPPVRVDQWLDAPHKIHGVKEFSPSSFPWAIWFVVGMLSALDKRLTWEDARSILAIGSDKEPAMKALRAALASKGIHISEETKNLKMLLEELHSSNNPDLLPVKTLLPAISKPG